jgi:L-threonylcarbamoyladenylate synthase
MGQLGNLRFCGSSRQDIAYASEVLRVGGLVAFPTETVYGLGADAANSQAVARVFAAKGRPVSHPLIVHLGGVDELDRWARKIPAEVERLAKRFWPGPLTLILKRTSHVPDEVTGGQDTVGLRVPNHPTALALLRCFSGGIAAPSANRFGRISPTRADHVISELGDAIQCVIDGGPCAVGLESTILDLSGGRPRILRPGAVTPDDLAETLGVRPIIESARGLRTPGCLPAHYAPSSPLCLLETAAIEPTVSSLVGAGQAVAVLSKCAPAAGLSGCLWWAMPVNPKEYSQVLYAYLREADMENCKCILVERLPVTPEWEPARNRLERAAVGAGQVKRGGE